MRDYRLPVITKFEESPVKQALPEIVPIITDIPEPVPESVVVIDQKKNRKTKKNTISLTFDDGIGIQEKLG